jgi:hypothetical protein
VFCRSFCDLFGCLRQRKEEVVEWERLQWREEFGGEEKQGEERDKRE